MTNNANVTLAYVISAIGIVMGCSVFNGISIMEMLLKKTGLGTGYSSGINGLYIPGIVTVLTMLGSYLFLRHVLKGSKEKMIRNYLAFCILLMLAMKIIGS